MSEDIERIDQADLEYWQDAERGVKAAREAIAVANATYQHALGALKATHDILRRRYRITGEDKIAEDGVIQRALRLPE